MLIESSVPLWLLAGILFFGALTTLLNLFFLLYALRIRSQVLNLRSTVSGMLQRAIDDLREFEALAMNFVVRVDETMPFQSSLPIHSQFDITLHTSVPIKQTLRSDVMVDTPLLNTKVPISVAAPVDFTVPIDLQGPVVVDSELQVALTVPIQLDVPVTIALGETELGAFVEQVRDSLVALKGVLDATEGRI